MTVKLCGYFYWKPTKWVTSLAATAKKVMNAVAEARQWSATTTTNTTTTTTTITTITTTTTTTTTTTKFLKS